MNIETTYTLKQKVKILPFNGKEGRIEGLYYSHYGLKYYVSFFVDYNDHCNYFFEDELEAIN